MGADLMEPGWWLSRQISTPFSWETFSSVVSSCVRRSLSTPFSWETSLACPTLPLCTALSTPFHGELLVRFRQTILLSFFFQHPFRGKRDRREAPPIGFLGLSTPFSWETFNHPLPSSNSTTFLFQHPFRGKLLPFLFCRKGFPQIFQHPFRGKPCPTP
jgi:hypothetical protein